MNGDTVLATLVIRDEGESPLGGRRWSLNLVVGGTFWRIGRPINGDNEQEAAQAFADALAPVSVTVVHG